MFAMFPGRGSQITVELSTTAIFGDLGGYFFGNVRYMLALSQGMGVAAHNFHCKNFLYSQPIFRILAHVNWMKFVIGECTLCLKKSM